jgi:hypothetical protein
METSDKESPAYPGSLLANAKLSGRGNAPVRAALMRQVQRTHGNRAVQRFVQRQAAKSAENDEDIGRRIQSKAGSGSSLDKGVQGRLEEGLGADLSGVRVHTDTEADHLARSVDSIAFTTGQDIFFRSGQYNPGSQEGMRLLAHEATHTVQQAQGPVSGTSIPGGVSVSDPSDSFEQAADHAAESVASGGVAAGTSPGGAAPGSVQRQGNIPVDEEEEPVQQKRNSSSAYLQREAAPEEEEEIQQKKDPATLSLQREAAPEEEEEAIQGKRDPSALSVQREAAPEEEEEAVQGKRNPSAPFVQREAAPEEEEEIQQKRDPSALTLQREAAPEEEEEMVQTKRDPSALPVQREAAPEDEEMVQGKRDPSAPAIQRKPASSGLLSAPTRTGTGLPRSPNGHHVQKQPDNDDVEGEHQVVQRQPPAAAPPATNSPPAGPQTTPGTAGAGATYRYRTPKLELEINKPLGNTGIKMKKISVHGEVLYQMFEPGQDDGGKAGSGSSTQIRGGVAHPSGHGGVQGEITESWKKSALQEMTGFEPQVKGQGELTSKEGKVGVTGQVKGKNVTFGLEFRLVGADWEKGKVEFSQLIFKTTLPAYKPAPMKVGATGQVTTEITENWEFSFDPDYKTLARWLGQRFLQIAASELAIGASFVGGGITTIVVGALYASLGSEINEKVEGAMTMLDNATNAYQNTMTGRQVSNAGGPGYAEGARLAEQALKKSEENVPKDVLMDEARKRDLKQEAWQAAWPGIRQGFIDAYKKEHYIEQFFYGDDAPGLKSLVQVLDAAATAPGRGGGAGRGYT